MARYASLALVLVVGGGLLLGAVNTPGEWYLSLEKPAFNPPSWVFGPVWTALYVLIAIAGWRTWRQSPRGTAMRLWWAQLALNFLWTPVFFSAHMIGLALTIILALFVTICGFVITVRHEDRLSAWLFAPYALWVAFAALLNGAILLMN